MTDVRAMSEARAPFAAEEGAQDLDKESPPRLGLGLLSTVLLELGSQGFSLLATVMAA